ncbi:DNA helicase RecQ [Clostridium tagluense]|uniref:DNA helicase RecQ n=1 Tax=Clostridium tagluense TaxID=360422 RepID=UPI001C6F087D|nr:DNA helicase RecQ [Clostridium tagluense]MBW9156557.1 DNA helicase RecQ [Clostridium tagluense]MCB2312519.1 DNA helicase RecQ [Clostridium tagluense]MCB2317214.1 DNA helicase RecQ [Clostridium tagluense]MCB2322078.1 DNA helicase RecQ [Clostridium tagluense]MCB2327163.1 DNA helicase RecQ [Clostridium tagluense]
MLRKAQEKLKKYYGYDSFRKGQESVIESIINGKDTFAVMPTGAGKSVCYQIPALLLPGVTLVISPLISLMKDQVDTLNSVGIAATYINSSLSINEVNERIDKTSKGEFKLLYVAPERLESEFFCNMLNRLTISLLAVDEAHCVSQWGHDFRPSYSAISSLIRKLHVRPIIAAFTATATQAVRLDVIKLLELREPDIYVTGFNRENLSFTVIRGENKRDFVLKYIEDNKDKVGIIYTATRKETDNLYELLNKKGYNVGKYHAGLADSQRKENQEKFLYDDINIIIATNAFGMGIDKSNVRYVIHYNLTKSMEAYYQEAGRGGRDGEPSECILLFSAADVLLQKFFIEQSTVSPERKISEYKKLQAMVDYAHTTRCLRQFILEYFGEENTRDKCDNCSTCNDESELVDITIEAQKIFSCILRMKERFGTTLIAEVLRGSKNKKVLDLGFEKLSTYGIIKQYTVKEIRDLINVLTAEDYLSLADGQFPVVRLKEKAVAVLKNQEKVYQKVEKKKAKAAGGNGLFEILRSLRKEISEREKVPPYIVFADSALREMSEYFPVNKSEMLSIKGVGESKLNKYGEEFIQAIKKYMNENNIEFKEEILYNEEVDIKALNEAAVEQKGENEDKLPSYVITYNMYKEGMRIEDIISERQLKSLTVQDHILKCAYEGFEVNLDDFIPKNHEALIIEVIEKIGASKLKPIKDALPKEVDYLAIKATIFKHANNKIS